jgi:hypothetical protein
METDRKEEDVAQALMGRSRCILCNGKGKFRQDMPAVGIQPAKVYKSLCYFCSGKGYLEC